MTILEGAPEIALGRTDYVPRSRGGREGMGRKGGEFHSQILSSFLIQQNKS